MIVDKNKRKEHSEEKNCQGGLQQENYLGGQIKGTMKNTGEGWKEIESVEKKNKQKEPWKWSRKKKKKLSRKI